MQYGRQEVTLAEIGQEQVRGLTFEPFTIAEDVQADERWQAYRDHLSVVLATLNMGHEELTERVRRQPELFCGSVEALAKSRDALKATADLMNAGIFRITVAIARSEADA